MAKFKIKLKLTGLEVEIEGDRQDAPQITAALTKQLGGMLAPAASLVSDESDQAKGRVIELDSSGNAQSAKKAKKAGRRSSKPASSDASEEVEFKHDSEKWGSPHQSWSASQKALWLLYIVTKQTDFTELSAGAIASSFNRHFRQAGEIRASNVSRDFGNLKAKKKPAWVGENISESPAKWYLTSEGASQAGKYVAEAKGESEV